MEEKELKERNKRIQEDNRLELQKVKQLRLEREREKAMREQELEMLQREKEAEHFKTWEEQEDNFHLQQAKLRSKIRIRDGRAKPIDLLAKYISAEDDDLAVEMHEPYTFLNGLTVADMEDLLEDIQVLPGPATHTLGPPPAPWPPRTCLQPSPLPPGVHGT